MQKKGKERGRPWFNTSPWLILVLTLTFGAYWLMSRESSGVAEQA